MTASENLAATIDDATKAQTTSTLNEKLKTKDDATQNDTKSSSQPQIIRKVGIVENYFHSELEKNGCINAATILFKSKLDLYANLELVNRAVQLWKRTQPFLRSRVVKDEKGENYFAYVDDDKIESLSNVSYLYYGRGRNGDKTPCPEKYWKMLMEREVAIPIDWKDGPMWRLMFIELGKTLEVNGVTEIKHEYCLIITVSHAIFDGISAFAALASLFLIIQGLALNLIDEKRDIYDAPVVDPVEQWLQRYLAEKKLNYADLRPFHQVEPFERPHNLLIGPNDESRSCYAATAAETETTSSDDDDHDAFYSIIDNKPVVPLKELKQISENSVTKFHLTKFKGDKFKMFAAKCKENKAKVNSVLNLMFIMAWRQVLKRLETTTDASGASKTKINYISLVNIRPFVQNLDPSLLLWFCNFMNCSFDGELDMPDEDTNNNQEEHKANWLSKFWEVARTESEHFHDRLRAGELFRIGESKSQCGANQVRLYYGLSNLVVPNELVNEIKLMKLSALYSLSSYRREWTGDLSYNTLISIDGEACWTLYYNSYFVKKETIEMFHKYVLDIYDKICS